MTACVADSRAAGADNKNLCDTLCNGFLSPLRQTTTPTSTRVVHHGVIVRHAIPPSQNPSGSDRLSKQKVPFFNLPEAIYFTFRKPVVPSRSATATQQSSSSSCRFIRFTSLTEKERLSLPNPTSRTRTLRTPRLYRNSASSSLECSIHYEKLPPHSHRTTAHKARTCIPFGLLPAPCTITNPTVA